MKPTIRLWWLDHATMVFGHGSLLEGVAIRESVLVVGVLSLVLAVSCCYKSLIILVGSFVFCFLFYLFGCVSLMSRFLHYVVTEAGYNRYLSSINIFTL